jgi:glycosyltransferase involved in cell wall biosynthesis
MKPVITVVTPTYNRADRLQLLFESLKRQTVSCFVWMIVDDGSTDKTEEVIQSFKRESISFPIISKKKINGGKHTALNVAIQEVETELFFIVDSDDVLTKDAIETILNDWNCMKDDSLCGISYLRGYDEKTVIGDLFPKDGDRDTFIDMRFNRGIGGDKAEVWVTRCLKEFGGFPEFEGERFISESVLWIKMARKYQMIFRNKIIYITEYLSGGLSKTGRSLRFKCHEGMAYGSLETMSKEFSKKIRMKETLLYVVYSKFGGKSFRQILNCPYPLLVIFGYLPGLLLYEYWKRKYVLSQL